MAPQLYDMAGLKPKDVDVVQSYENFTGGVLMSLVEHGFFTAEEANDFLTPENLMAPTGKLPLNTWAAISPNATCTGWSCRSRRCARSAAHRRRRCPRPTSSMVISGPMVTPVSSMIFGTEATL